MKRFILYFTTMLAVCAMTSCDKEETFDVTPQTLAQTVWNAEIEYFDENGNATGSNSMGRKTKCTSSIEDKRGIAV